MVVLGLVLLESCWWLVLILLCRLCFLWLKVDVDLIRIVLLIVFLGMFGVGDLIMCRCLVELEGIMFSGVVWLEFFGVLMVMLLMLMLFSVVFRLWMIMKCFLFWLWVMFMFGRCCSDLVIFLFGYIFIVLEEMVFLMVLLLCLRLIVWVCDFSCGWILM